MAVLVEEALKRHPLWRDLAASFVLAHLVFYRVYTDIFAIYSNRSNHYYVRELPSTELVMALLTEVLIATVLLCTAIRVLRGTSSRWIPLVLKPLIATVVVVGVASVIKVEAGISVAHLNRMTSRGTLVTVTLGVIACMVVAFLLKKSAISISFSKAVRFLYLVSLPLCALSLYMTLRVAFFAATSMVLVNPVPVGSGVGAPGSTKMKRAVVMVFDEADFRILFKDRPADLRLPNLDGLVARSFFCTNAYPPSGGTSISLPSLLTGKYIGKVVPSGSDSLLMYGRNGESMGELKAAPNVFDALHQQGVACGITGWAHPYSRMFDPKVVQARWYEIPSQLNSLGNTYGEHLVNIARSTLETKIYSVFGQSLLTKAAMRNYQNILYDTNSMIFDNGYQFVFSHFPIPHPPYFYDRVTRSFTLSNSRTAGYIDALALMDLTIGNLIASLKSRQMYDDTMLVITSDHWWRTSKSYDGKEDLRVPFIVKLPGQSEGYVYGKIFNTTVLKGILQSFFNGKYADAAGLSAWLDANVVALPPVSVSGD